MKEAVELILKALVSDPSTVDVREVESKGVLRIEVRVSEKDMGKVIGRQGRTVKAIRSLLHAASVKHGRRFVLEIIE